MHRVTINILCLVTHLVTELFRDAIPNTLMWPVLVEEVFVFIKHVLESGELAHGIRSGQSWQSLVGRAIWLVDQKAYAWA